MRIQAKPVRTIGIALLVVGACIVASAVGAPQSPWRSAASTDGVVFVRVYGNVQIDEASDWSGPTVLEDVPLGSGSGFVVAPSGIVITNHHVIAGGRLVRTVRGTEVEAVFEVERVEVSVFGGEGHETYDASILASDSELDLAALQIPAVESPYLAMGDSDAAASPQKLMVIGFPFGNAVEVGRSESADAVPGPTVTVGSLSALRSDDEGRTRYLQTDATVHPGSSGGPILDEDGFVLGVVSMKLSLRERPEEGAAFGVPINAAKDFLESNGLLHQVPGHRLQPVAHDLDWKGIRVDLFDGMADQRPERVRVETGVSGSGISFAAIRFWSQDSVRALEGPLLSGRITRGFAPTQTREPQRYRTSERQLFGSTRGVTSGGKARWVEYTVAEVGPSERLAARFEGPPSEMAFNLGSVRRSLATMEARRLLTGTARIPVRFQETSLGSPAVSAPVPIGWSDEPASRAACPRVPIPDGGIASSPQGDFTTVLRTLWWRAATFDPAIVARACGQPPGSPSRGYARNGRRYGSNTAIWGTFQRHGDSILLMEAEALPGTMPLLGDIYVAWTAAAASD